jgi:hypothetical protein
MSTFTSDVQSLVELLSEELKDSSYLLFELKSGRTWQERIVLHP